MAENCTQAPLDAFGTLLCQYQFSDGGRAGDAPDVCGEADRPVPEQYSQNGLLVPVDDEEDHYTLELTGNTTVTLEKPHSTTLAAGADILVEVRPVTAGACGTAVGTHTYGQNTQYLFGLPSDTDSVSLNGLPPGTYDVGVRLAYGTQVSVQTAAGQQHALDDGAGIDIGAGIPMMCQPYCGLSKNLGACVWGIQITLPVDSALCFFGAAGTFISAMVAMIVACTGNDVPPQPNVRSCAHILEALLEWLLDPTAVNQPVAQTLPVHYRIVATTE